MTASGSVQLSYCAARTRKTSTTASRNASHGGVAGLELKEREFRPFRAHLGGQRVASRGGLQPGDRFAGADAGRRRAVHRRRRIEIVALHHGRTGHFLNRHERANRDHHAAIVLHLQPLEIVGLAAEIAAGLHVDLPRPAEAVEIVDVQRAEIDLQRIDDFGDVHTVRLCRDAVDLQEQPGRIGPEAGVNSFQLRVGHAGFDDALSPAS